MNTIRTDITIFSGYGSGSIFIKHRHDFMYKPFNEAEYALLRIKDTYYIINPFKHLDIGAAVKLDYLRLTNDELDHYILLSNMQGYVDVIA